MTESTATKLCLCGCGGTTKATFVPGHDMRYKSALFAKALAGDSEALATVEARGWSTIFEAKKLKSARKATVAKDRAQRVRPNGRPSTDSENPEATIARLNVMKEAAKILKTKGRYGVSAGEFRIPITRDNAQSIIDGTHPDL